VMHRTAMTVPCRVEVRCDPVREVLIVQLGLDSLVRANAICKSYS
jgi:hypothetical protein